MFEDDSLPYCHYAYCHAMSLKHKQAAMVLQKQLLPHNHLQL